MANKVMSTQTLQHISKYSQKLSLKCNPFNLQMIPEFLRKQIFKQTNEPISETELTRCLAEFSKHSLDIKRTEAAVNNIDLLKKLPLPTIYNNNIEDHFWEIGSQQSKPYDDLIPNLINSKTVAKPTKWLNVSGWTKYVPGQNPVSVPYPEDDIIVFDVEVCVRNGYGPVIATALSSKAWYCWISQVLHDGTILRPTKECNFEDLIPIENECVKDRPRLIIGHNVGYDRARIREQYLIERSALRFLDTMSLHICISGITSYQRNMMKLKQKNCEGADDVNNHDGELSSLNSLSEVVNLYCKKSLRKEPRNIFVQGDLQDIRDNLEELIDYCSCDTEATFDVFKVVYPLYKERFPHPVSLAGMLELGTSYLPVNSNWRRFIEDSEFIYDELENESKMILIQRANNACKLLHNDDYKKNLWLWSQDWSVQKYKMNKVKTKNNVKVDQQSENDNSDQYDYVDKHIIDLEKEFKHLLNTDYLPKRKPVLPGYPNWYRKLCTDPSMGPHNISTSMRITPLLLHLTWEGYPLYFHGDYGWGFLVPFTDNLAEVDDKFPLKELLEKCPIIEDFGNNMLSDNNLDHFVEMSNELKNRTDKEIFWKKKKNCNNENQNRTHKSTGVWTGAIVENCCWFLKLPHKDGDNNRVGNPLSKDFLSKFSNKLLAGDTDSAHRMLQIAKTLSYWRNNRDRILNQLVVWSKHGQLSADGVNNLEYGAILPQVVVAGTLTRRAVERCWMTASNSQQDRIGSELRAMIQAPNNYCIVGADVDSQELWIASLLGDYHLAKVHGCTPFSWMTLKGNKADKTDMHSVTAKAINISRDHAKVINYARIYGAGQVFAEQLLKQFNPSLSALQARTKARKMFEMTKGKKVFQIKQEYIDIIDPGRRNCFTLWQALELAKLHGKRILDMFENGQWIGGTESEMFNCLEDIANTPNSKTPFLESRLSRALDPENLSDTEKDRFLPTRINWVVQSGAVDFLYLMLVSMRWLMGDKIRFCLSFHDEVRYLVPNHLTAEAVIAMHLTNLLTRAFFSSKLGIYDLPLSVAFFASVEVDQILRKDANDDCVTPSNPHGLQKQYGIELGKSLDVYQAIKMLNDVKN